MWRADAPYSARSPMTATRPVGVGNDHGPIEPGVGYIVVRTAQDFMAYIEREPSQ